MRPRVFPAEDMVGLHVALEDVTGASMRPRVFPAEDPRRGAERGGDLMRFNEAAGIPRGRRRIGRGRCGSGARFNEAAGIPRGRRWRTSRERGQAWALQ